MKKMFFSLTMPLFLIVAVTAIAFAESDRDYSKTDYSKVGKSDSAMMDKGMNNPNFLKSQRVSKLIGAEVQDRNGESLGKIDDLITGEDGRIDYLVIARGGMMGVGENVVPVPVSSIDSSTRKDGEFVLNVQKKKFDEAPGFAKNDWDGLKSSEWQSKTRGYFGEDRDTTLDQRRDINTTTDKMKNKQN